ncbi:MAG: TetR/AcrR family transcriptional regulator [Burkholderiaceae bacterium]
MPKLSTTVFREKRQHVINAARMVFSETGYAESSIKEIIRKAGVSNGAFFVYFKNKKEILIEIIHQNLGVFRGRVDEIVKLSAEHDYEIVIEMLLELVKQITLGPGRAMSLHVWSSAMLDKEIMSALKQEFDAIMASLIRLSTFYIEKSHNTGVSANRVATGLFAVFIPGYIIQILMFGPTEPKAYMSSHRSAWAIQ